VQLLAIGILGEYVGRIYAEAKARPIYLIMDKESSNVEVDDIESSMVEKHG